MALFVNEFGEGVEASGKRRRSRAARSPDRRRILRDRAMLLLRRAGLSYGEIAEVAKAIADEPIKDLSFIRRRILAAEKYGEWETAQARLCDS